MIKPADFIGCDSNYNDSSIIIFGAPYDGTTSFRPGARFAPSYIRMESNGIETYSPFADKDIFDYKIHDSGDFDFPFGNRDDVLKMIYEYAAQIFDDGKKPLMIGGEHLVSLPVIKAAYEKYSDLHIIHFDAHTDLREDYLGEKLSHATVIKRVWDFIGKGRIFQFGIRSGTREEFKWAEQGNVHQNKYNLNGLDLVVKQLAGKPVYMTIDLDVLDPSIFPGTGTPEAGGVSYNDLQNALLMMSSLNIIGADMVELAPHYDHSGVSTAVACKILRELLLCIA